MDRRRSPKALIAIGLALQIPSRASACRVGWDQHLFEESPAPNVLAGARIVRVHFSNARPALDGWPANAASPDGQNVEYTLIGIARILGESAARDEAFPVYAIVTSCSGFDNMPSRGASFVVDGDYDLIGRFRSDAGGRRFYAGGVRADGDGPIYQGWHF